MSYLHTMIPSRIAFTVLLFLSAGCLEYETRTTVHPDGSFTRTITVTGDSSSISSWDFKIPADSTWSIIEQFKVDDKKWTVKAEREFPSSQAWTIWKDSLDRRVLESSVTVDRRFRFFTTTYTFTETIASYNPFRLIPVTDFISPSELDMFLRFEVLKESNPSRGDSLALDDAGDRFEEWEIRTRLESFFRAIVDHLDRSAGLEQSRLDELKEALVQSFMEEGKGEDYSFKRFRDWGRTTKQPEIRAAIEAASEDLESLRRDIEYIKAVSGDSYESRIDMPGEITTTNGQREGLNGAAWNDYIAYAYVSDFTMSAESTIVNIWAIVLTIGIIIGIPILMWVAKKTREKRSVVS